MDLEAQSVVSIQEISFPRDLFRRLYFILSFTNALTNICSQKELVY